MTRATTTTPGATSPGTTTTGVGHMAHDTTTTARWHDSGDVLATTTTTTTPGAWRLDVRGDGERAADADASARRAMSATFTWRRIPAAARVIGQISEMAAPR